MGNKTRLAQMQKVRSHPKTKRKNKEQHMKDEALKLALEALGLYQAAGFGNSTDFNKQHEAFYKAQTAITAIKQALAAPESEKKHD
jgi:hypothetical protein